MTPWKGKRTRAKLWMAQRAGAKRLFDLVEWVGGVPNMIVIRSDRRKIWAEEFEPQPIPVDQMSDQRVRALANEIRSGKIATYQLLGENGSVKVPWEQSSFAQNILHTEKVRGL